MLMIAENHFKNEKTLVLLVDKISEKNAIKKGSKKKKKINLEASISKEKKVKNVFIKGTYFHCSKYE